MIKNKMKDCTHITLYTSESCNLACRYCEMAHTINVQKHLCETKKVKESFTNGVFLNNLKISIDRLGVDPTKLISCDMWGQEPTLTLDEVTKGFFPEFLKMCPNLKKCFFSTNGVAYYERIVNFINMLIKELNGRPFDMGIQFSYDGKTNTAEQRGADPEGIKNNIRSFVQELNQITFPSNFTVRINFHHVVDNNVIKKFSDYNNKDGLMEYMDELLAFPNELRDMNLNKNLLIHEFSPGIIYPYNATKEEGQMLAQFYRNCDKVKAENIKYKDIFNMPYWGLSHLAYHLLKVFPYEPDGIEAMNAILKGDLSNAKIKDMSHNCTCGYNLGSLKIRYDGTLMHCQNALLGLTDEELKGTKGFSFIVQKEKVKHHFYPNAVTDSDEILDKYLYECRIMAEQQYPLLLQNAVNMMLMLLKAGQIDESYNDPDKLLRHAYFMVFCGTCPHNKMMDTNTVFGMSAGWYRFFLNGFMDIAEEEYKKDDRGPETCFSDTIPQGVCIFNGTE